MMVTTDLVGFRLSPQQELLWQAQGSRPVPGFVCQGLLEIRGLLERSRLRRAVEQAVERHEILRTAFRRLPGMSLPVQVILDRGEVLWNEPALSAPAEEGLAEIFREDRQAPPDPEAPALRASLVHFGDDRHALLLTLPGLAADPWSLRVLARDIAALYTDGESATSLPEPLQYADAAETLHEWLGPDDGLQATFWRQQDPPILADAKSAEPAGPETVRRRLPVEPVAGLAGRLGVSVDLLLLAAWNAALWGETGVERRSVAVALDGRTFEEAAEAVGLYARYLPVRCDAGPASTLAEVAKRLENALAATATRQDGFSLDRLPAGLHRAAGAVPIWPLGFDSGREIALSPAFSLRPELSVLNRFELRLSVMEEAAAIRLDIHYDPARQGRGQAERLLGRLERVLAGAAARPDSPLGEIDILTEAERRELLADFNATAIRYPEGTVSDLFAEQAARAPDAVALVDASTGLRITYNELASRARRLAHHLRAQGVGPESRVGICLERGPEMAVALLGTLEAGAAYVPLDPGYPAERLRLLAEDAGLAALLTRERLLPLLPPAAAPRTVLLDPDSPDARATASRGDRRPPGPVDPGSAAYVIYTSGSTGRPKGVVVTHRGLMSYLCWAREAYAAGTGRGAPVHSPLGFDLTVTSLLAPLAAGSAVTLLPEEEGVEGLAAALRREQGFGLVKITPAHLGLLRQLTPEGEPPPTAACLVIGGDALRAEDLAPWREGAPATRIVNEYGPTETVVGCCVYTVRPDDPPSGPVPIGRPIANARLYVIGPGLRPVPAGVSGELWIGGDGVARGYLGRPDLTAERFVPDPFTTAERAGGRLYRSGDLVRLVRSTPGRDLQLEFLGRIDDQVKIRGHRVEPGEVAAALAAHPGLQDAAVVAQGQRDERRLVAYVVPRDRARRPGAGELRVFLAERLPEPMIPSAFVPLEGLPLTAHGKLDHAALPEPEEATSETTYASPRDLTEELLAEIWARVLGVERVGIDDPFFSLGGDSIRSIQVITLAQRRGMTLTVQEIFRFPTIRALAGQLRQGAASPQGEAGPAPDGGPFSLVDGGDLTRLPSGLADTYPLARLQAGMLFHSEYGAGTAIFHDLHSFHLCGRYSRELLGTALGELLHRHPVLRTAFDLAGFSEPLQLVFAEAGTPFAEEDLRDLPAEEQPAAVAAWLREERLRGFDWNHPPLVRFHVHRRTEESFQLTLSFHHAVLDGWSAALLLTELFHRYAALLAGDQEGMAEPPAATFREFVALERQALASAEARDFWRRQVAGSTLAALPCRRPAGDAEVRAEEVIVTLDEELTAGLRLTARSLALPLKSVLLAAHCRVLARLSGQSDVVSGVIANGRPEGPDGDRVLGLFLNTLPLRLDLTGGAWSGLVREAFELERASLPFRRFPLAEIQRMEGGRPLFEIGFNYLHYHVYRGVAEVPGFQILESSGYEEGNFFTTHFQVDPGSFGLRLILSYPAAELDRADVEAFGRYYLAALTSLAHAPEDRYEESSLLSAAELRLLETWSRGPAAASPACLHHLVEAQARRTPGATALVCGGVALTCAELDARADRLARHLVSLGIGPEDRVGVCAARSPRLVVALLAVLKAGGAYVPLDPAYPRERLAWILADAGAAVLLTEERLLPSLPAGDLTVVLLDAEPEGAGDPGRPPAAVGPDHLAYLLYTSGSTGRPKGVAIPHGAAAAMVAWATSAFSPEDLAGMLATTSVCFDLSVFELFAPLACGGAVLLVDDALALARRPDLEIAARATLLNTVPSAAAELARSAALPRVRVVGLAGEPLPRALVDQLHAAGVPRVYNLYGPSEDTTYSTFALVPAGDPRPPAIGRAIAGGRVHLLDAHLQPVPPGVAGEIFLGGAGLARGYLGRPDLTAASFLPDPWSGSPGARLYRTGDLGRHRRDGEIEFLGRMDHQVKVRGFRIEPGEIEDALARHPGVREAAVLAHTGPDGGLRLVAFVVPRDPAEAGALPGGLRNHLRQCLPEHMVPSAFVALTALPRTPNGKVDRRALPALEPARPEGETPYVPPRGPVEEALAGIWAEALGSGPVGAHDDFFALGGHSLLATRIVSRVRAALGAEVPLRALFDAPTVAGLAAVVERALRSGEAASVPPLVALPDGGDLSLSFAQQRLWFLDLLEPGSPAYNIPGAVLLEGRLDAAALAAALGEVAARHASLRTTFGDRGGEPVQRIAPPAFRPLPHIDLTGLPRERRETEVSRLATDEARRPFDLRRGPLLRTTLVRLAPEEHALLLTMHHIVSDGWSTGVLIREVAALYPACAAGRPSPLPPLPLQYHDYARWQRSWLCGEVLERQLAWWRERLAGAPPFLDLPSDRPRPPVPSGRGGLRDARVPPTATAALARREGATLFMVLLAAFDALLSHYTGGVDLVVGSDIANRTRAETEGLIGFFVNQIALRADLSGDPTVRELLARTRETALGAYAHQDLPFEKLVEELRPERDASRQPVFQVVFVLQNIPQDALSLPGLELRPLPAAGGTAKLDLTVVATDTPGGLRLAAEYSSDLFDPPTIERLLAAYATLLTAAVADPGRRLSELPLLGPAQRQQVLAEWNDSARDFPGGDTLFYPLLAERSATRPEAVAAVCEGERLTYGELLEVSGRLARHLSHQRAAAAAGPEGVVPLLADRGLAFLNAVVGIFRAGGAYLPLDPNHPLKRLAHLVTGSGARLVLASRGYAAMAEEALAAVPPELRPRILVLEDLLERETPAGVPLPAEPEPGNLAYVLYTSGSTGTPKGAMIEHRGMLNHLWAKVADLGLNEEDVVAQTASQTFDISVWQLLAALLAGGRVQIVPDEVAHDPLRLLREVEAAGVTVLETVPSLLRLMLDALEQSEERPRLARLRWMIPTGEALPPELCRRWLRLYPGVPLLNAYGPTECSDDVTHRPVRVPPEPGRTQVPIGRPVPNLRVHVLGPGLQPCPVGVPGELFVGGAGVGRGYLDEPARTAQAWVPDPFASRPGGRLYRTGDLARLRPGGEIDFLGRADHQVKLRGHRIELGEIEAALASHPEVQQSAAVIREDVPGNRCLVAYVVPRGGQREEDAVKVEQWESVFDEVYRQEAVSERDAAVHLRVWIDSYTGNPLPEDEILECVEDSVSRIRALSPRRVLEIGCGSGLLLERIAPGCAEYWGTDISAEVLETLERRLAARDGLPPLRLLHRTADDFRDIPEGVFDTVILNEVAQYFPGADYLASVLDLALAATAPGGTVFVGGVRSLPLQEAFAASVEIRHLEEADAEVPLSEVRARVRRRMAQEKELLVDPALFEAVAHRAGLVGLEIQLKGGRAHNELTRFRYDVVLLKAGPEEDGGGSGEMLGVRWAEVAALSELRRRLEERPGAAVTVTGIPNARLLGEMAALGLLRDETASSLDEAVQARHRAPAGVEPEDLWQLGRELGRQAEVRWDGEGGGLLEARFGIPGRDLPPRPPAQISLPSSWSRWGNDPVRGLVAEGLVPRLRSHLAERLPEAMLPAAFVLLDALPLTPNGKLDRRALPAPDQARPELGDDFVAPAGPVEETLAGIWQQVLRLDRIGVHDNFFQLGGDSILSIQAVSLANQAGLHLTPRQMFQHQTIAELAAVVGTVEAAAAEQGAVTGELPLTPIQRWFFEQDFAALDQWNQSVLMEVRRLSPGPLTRALAALLEHHDALRLRFPGAREGRPRPFLPAPGGDVPFTALDLSALPADRHAAAVASAAEQLHAGLDLERGPLVRAALHDLGPDTPGRLHLVIHHLAVDGISWRVLAQDLESALLALARGETPALPPKTLSFKAWAELLDAHARTLPAAERSFWLDVARADAAPLPVDLPGGTNTMAAARTVLVSLTPEETQELLQEVPRAYRTQINDALLTALARTLARWTGGRRVRIDLEGHGREELVPGMDTSRTIGWFTTEYPLLLETDGEEPGTDLKRVKEQLRAVPRGGLGYGMLRYLATGGDTAKLAGMPPPGLIFNYLGQLDQVLPEGSLFAAAGEEKGTGQSPRERRTHLIEVNSHIAGGRLRLAWTYSEGLHRRDTIEAVAADYVEELRRLIEHCRAPEAGGFTPSDFAFARIDQGELDLLLASIEQDAGEP